MQCNVEFRVDLETFSELKALLKPAHYIVL